MICPFTQAAGPELDPPSAEPPLELVDPLDPLDPPELVDPLDPPELVEPLDPPLEEAPPELPEDPLLVSAPLEVPPELPPGPLEDAPLLPPPGEPGSCVEEDPQATLARGRAIRATSDRPIRCSIDMYLARNPLLGERADHMTHQYVRRRVGRG